ncbi:hypothetical protein FDECE_881 [Fusarium decemcellulare]|nr:hypothetical protein FDECE_881 [Fusarium decemcellulare]
MRPKRLTFSTQRIVSLPASLYIGKVMEVVGVIAAIPGLIEIVQAVTTAVRGLSKRKVAAKTAEDLITQLRDLEDILKDVQKRCKQGGSDRLQLQRLSSSLTELRSDLCSLQDVLQTSKLTKEPSRYLKRALFLSTSLEKTLKESLARLAQAKASLTLLIVHHQDGVTEELRGISISGLRLKMRDLLRPSGDSFIPNKTPGTCEWIWSHPTFCDWVESSSTTSNSHFIRALCIYGIKGCGKSVLVKSIAETLRGRGEIALHFSFWAGSEAQRKLLDLLRTLMWQTLSHITDDNLKRLSEVLISDASINERVLVEAICGALSMIGSKVYCAIDGIDESTEDWNSHTDGCLSTIVNLAKSHTNFRLLLAGREPSMRTVLKQSYPRLEITESLIRNDINKLIVAELNDSLAIHTPAIRDMVEESLKAKTQVMFLWATLVFKELRRCFSVEEIKQTLKQVPHDLDREYHRLFLQLMARSRGTLNKPSTSMKRARHLIYSLLACPEPMTTEDLCYAYAAQVNSSGTIEDDLITTDGIMDACGDFVRVTEGRYHLIHASAADFLNRPQKDWEEQDSDILYFRIDLTEAHVFMCSACFKYVESLDLGYPLTDGGASLLPSQYPFFSYATRFLPFHFIQALEDNGRGHPDAPRFARTRQFCALVEYALVTLQNSLQDNGSDSIYYWVELLTVGAGLGGFDLKQAFYLELQRRLHAFGTQDERYQSWQALAIFLQVDAKELHLPQPPPATTVVRNDKLGAALNGKAFSSLPRHLGQTHGLAVQRMSRNLHTVSKLFMKFKKATTDLLASSAESLSIPMLLLAVIVARREEELPLAEKLAAMSVRKTRGKGDICELCSLLLLVIVGSENDTHDLAEIEDMIRRSVQIANRLPVQPHVQYLKMTANHLLALVLIDQGKMEETRAVISSVEKLVGKNREKCSSHLWEYGLCHTRRGTAHRMRALRMIAEVFLEMGNNSEAVDLTTQAMAVFEESGSKPNFECRASFVTRRDALYSAKDFDQCLASSRHLLGFLEGFVRSDSQPEDTHIRRETQRVLAKCLAAQDDMSEAEKCYLKAADEADLLKSDKSQAMYVEELSWLVEDLILLGQYERAQSIARKILDITGITYSDDKKDSGFHNIGPLVCKLREVGSIDSDYKEFLQCYSLLMASDEPKDTEVEADWWEDHTLDTMKESVPSFSKKVILPCLKSIDTCLRLVHGLQRAFWWYRYLAHFFFRQGDIQAAELITSEASSRIFADPCFSSSCVFLLASDICFYTEKFSPRKTLLHSAYEKDLSENFDAHSHFSTEMCYAVKYVGDLEDSGEDLAREGMRLQFVEQACDHLARAIKAKDDIQQEELWELDTDQSEDEHGAQRKRQAKISDLQTRLERLGAGFMLDESMAKLEMEATKTRKPRRAKSYESFKAISGPRRPASIAFDQGSLDVELVP